MTEGIFKMQFAKVNRKSVDLILDIPFTEDMSVELRSVVAPDSLIGHKLVETSIAASDDEFKRTRVILVEDDELLESDGVYEVSVYNGEALLGRDNFKVIEPPVVTDAKVEGIGTRLIKVEFDYPIRNLGLDDKTDKYNRTVESGDIYEVVETRLINFYVKYFGADMSSNIEVLDIGNPIPYNGYVITQIDATLKSDDSKKVVSKPFSVEISDDLRTVVIQSNLKSLPQSDNHLLSVNYSRQQDIKAVDLNHILTDYHEDTREVPIFEKPFSLKSAQYPAEIVDIEVISLTEIIVTFDKAVILKSDEIQQVICDGKLKDLVKDGRERVDDTLNKIKYYIDSTTPLTPGDSVELSVTPMTDSSGLKTKSNTITKPVIAVPPTLDKARQILSAEISELNLPVSKDKTAIYLEYSTGMDLTSATTISKYTLVAESDQSQTPIKIDSIAQYTKNQFDKYYMVVDELVAGYYTLKVSEVKDLTDIVMVPAVKRIEIVDQTVPEVTRVLVTSDKDETEKAILIMFDDNMNAPLEERSITKEDNVKLLGIGSELGESFILNEKSKSILINNNKWARLTLPEVSPNNLVVTKDTTEILLGYARLRDIKYITNASGNIYPLCERVKIDANVLPITPDPTQLDASGTNVDTNAKITVKDDKTLVFYTGHQDKMFDLPNVNQSDFVVTRNGITIIPESINLLESLTQLEIKFSNSLFTSATTDITVKVVDKPVTKDIFGRKIKSGVCKNVINDLSASLVSISRISVDYATPQKVVVALNYSDEIIATDPRDFVMETKEGILVPVSSATIKNKNVIELVASTYLSIDLDSSTLYVSTADGRTGGLRTKDNDGKVINSIVKELVKDSKISSVKWTMSDVDTKLNESLFNVQLEEAINWKYINTAISEGTTIQITEDSANVIEKTNTKITIKIAGKIDPTNSINLGSLVIDTEKDIVTSIPAGDMVISVTIDNKGFSIKVASGDLPLAPDAKADSIHAYFVPNSYTFKTITDEVYLRVDSSQSVAPTN